MCVIVLCMVIADRAEQADLVTHSTVSCSSPANLYHNYLLTTHQPHNSPSLPTLDLVTNRHTIHSTCWHRFWKTIFSLKHKFMYVNWLYLFNYLCSFVSTVLSEKKGCKSERNELEFYWLILRFLSSWVRSDFSFASFKRSLSKVEGKSEESLAAIAHVLLCWHF